MFSSTKTIAGFDLALAKAMADERERQENQKTISHMGDAATIDRVRAEVVALCQKFPVCASTQGSAREWPRAFEPEVRCP